LSESEVLAYARKQRHAKLLEKIRNSIGLSVSELAELEEYEIEADMPKTKPIPGKTKIASVEQRYELFAREYVKDFNATQAAIRAGYSKKTANPQAARLLTIVSVLEKIEKYKAKAVKTAELSLASVLEETKKLAFSNIGRYIEFNSSGIKVNDSSALNMDELACIAEVSEHAVTKKRKSIKFKLHDKAKALNTLLEYFKDMPGTGPEERKVIRMPLQIKK
jgi:phage terminase small subunit